MENYRTQLRLDSAHAPAFLMVQPPPSPTERQVRLAEWVLAVWMNLLDPNVMGVRRVDDENNEGGVPTVHIAIPLGYRRKQLAATLAIAQIEDEQCTPRVNLIASVGSDEPHSFIRVPADIIFSKFISSVEFQLLDSKEFNDPTLDVPARANEEFVRVPTREKPEEVAHLRWAVQQGLAMRNAPIGLAQIQMLINKNTGEKWIKIKNVDTSMRPAIQSALKQAGIHAISPTTNDLRHLDWAILFSATEAEKLLFD